MRLKEYFSNNGKLYGDIYGHSKFEDGTSVVTSKIKQVIGVPKTSEKDAHQLVITESGSEYELYRKDAYDKESYDCLGLTTYEDMFDMTS